MSCADFTKLCSEKHKNVKQVPVRARRICAEMKSGLSKPERKTARCTVARKSIRTRTRLCLPSLVTIETILFQYSLHGSLKLLLLLLYYKNWYKPFLTVKIGSVVQHQNFDKIPKILTHT